MHSVDASYRLSWPDSMGKVVLRLHYFIIQEMALIIRFIAAVFRVFRVVFPTIYVKMSKVVTIGYERKMSG